MSGTKAILIGYSGHGVVVGEAALLSGIDIIGYTERKQAMLNCFSLPYLGNDELESFNLWGVNSHFILGVGDNTVRKIIATRVLNNKAQLTTVIHPESNVSQYVEIENGVFIARNAALNPLCRIGTGVIVNTSASIDHECKIGDYSHIAPGAVLAGNVTIGKGVFVGANSVIKQGVTIGDNATIGAGSVIIRDVSVGETIIGNPGREING